MLVKIGSAWPDSLPQGWAFERIGQLFELRNTSTTSLLDAPLSVTKAGVVEQLDQVALSVDGAPKKLVKPGDIVINSRSDRKGSAGVAPRRGSVSVISTVLMPRSIDARYAHHVMRSVPFQEEFYRYGSGIVADLWSTRWSEMKSIRLPVPNAAEQRAIADFLDHETAEIDALVRDQVRFQELTVERDQAVISRLGHCAERTIPLRRLASVTLGKMIPTGDWTQQLGADSLLMPYLRAAHVQPGGLLVFEDDVKKMPFSPSEASLLSISRGDVVVVEGGAGFGRSAVIESDMNGWGFQNSINRIRMNQAEMEPWFIHLILRGLLERGDLAIMTNQATIPHLTAEKLAAVPIPWVPYVEQRLRLEQVRGQLDDSSELRNFSRNVVALAKERRAALISAAVTGQIDVTAKRKPAAEQLEDDIAQGVHTSS